MSILAGVIGGAGSLLGSLIGAGSQASTNEKNMEIAKYQAEWQTKENEKAYQRALEMWNKENTYNSPIQQMARLKEAGLNPNLVYGSGSVVGNTSGSTPKYEPAKFNAPTMQAYRGWNLGLSDGISAYLQSKLAAEEIENKRAQNTLIKQQAATEATKQANYASTTARSEFDLSLARELKDVSLARSIAEMNKSEAGAKSAWTEANRKVLQYELDKALYDTRIKVSQAEYTQLMESVRKLQQDNDINSFRNAIERVVGKDSLAQDVVRRLLFALSPKETDSMFNPK